MLLVVQRDAACFEKRTSQIMEQTSAGASASASVVDVSSDSGLI